MRASHILFGVAKDAAPAAKQAARTEAEGVAVRRRRGLRGAGQAVFEGS